MASGSEKHSTRDRQRSRVYNWEATVVYQYSGDTIAFHNISNMVNYVWENEGLLYPPRVTQFQPNVKSKGADATRQELRFHGQSNGRQVLHELAHAMTDDVEYYVEGHGPEFVGMVMHLYSKYLGIDLLMLEHTATQMGVLFNRGQRPVFLDK